MSTINPDLDGIYHINVYSKGKTWLGRNLSNFSYSPIETEDGKFNSVEGYWYWLSSRDEALRSLWGFDAKKRGREVGGKDWLDDNEFKLKIKKAIDNKLRSNNVLLKTLQECNLPLTHYYVYSNRVVLIPKSRWIIEFIEKYKNQDFVL